MTELNKKDENTVPEKEETQDIDVENNTDPAPEDEFTPLPAKPEVSPVVAAVIGLTAVIFLYYFVGSMLSYVIISLNPGKTEPNILRILTAGTQILFILLPALVFAKMFFPNVGEILRAKIPLLPETGLFIAGLIALIPLLDSFMSIQNYYIDLWSRHFSAVRNIKFFFDSADKLLQETYGNIMSARNILDGALVIAVAGIVPAICEEVMFRGYIQKSLELRIKPFTAALITASFFGIFHFNPYGTIVLISLGLYFGYSAYKTGSIFVPMILHFLFNLLSVIAFFYAGEEELAAQGTQVDPGSSASIFFVFLIIFGFVLFTIKRYYKLRKA